MDRSTNKNYQQCFTVHELRFPGHTSPPNQHKFQEFPSRKVKLNSLLLYVLTYNEKLEQPLSWQGVLDLMSNKCRFPPQLSSLHFIHKAMNYIHWRFLQTWLSGRWSNLKIQTKHVHWPFQELTKWLTYSQWQNIVTGIGYTWPFPSLKHWCFEV